MTGCMHPFHNIMPEITHLRLSVRAGEAKPATASFADWNSSTPDVVSQPKIVKQ